MWVYPLAPHLPPILVSSPVYDVQPTYCVRTTYIRSTAYTIQYTVYGDSIRELYLRRTLYVYSVRRTSHVRSCTNSVYAVHCTVYNVLVGLCNYIFTDSGAMRHIPHPPLPPSPLSPLEGKGTGDLGMSVRRMSYLNYDHVYRNQVTSTSAAAITLGHGA